MNMLPPEIFIAIFSLLPPRDLPSVIPLSNALIGIGRSLLYKSVDLRSDDTHIQSTVLLLQRKPELCKNIKRATLATRQSSIGTTPWIPADFLNGWDNLRSLTMIGMPFRTIDDQEVFRSTLMQSCTSLAQFAYRPGADLFLGPDFEISGLKRLSWQTEQATRLETQIISVMRSSMNTLTHISFKGHLSLLDQTSCYYEFLDFWFPLLTSLELGSLFNTTSQEQTDTAITQFILAHPNIHHLSLGKFRIGTTSFQFDGSLLVEDSLPNLRSFEGFPMNITFLARSNVRSLPKLTTLSLFSDLDDHSLAEMFETVKTGLGDGSGHFSCVRNLRFEFHTELSHRMETHVSDLAHRRWVDEFNEICPSVINWYGRLGPVNRDHLANIFNLYENLEIISLPRQSLILDLPINDPGINSYFRTIAKKCPRIRQLVARKPAYTELKDYVFCLRRGPDDGTGDFDSVYLLDHWLDDSDGCEDEWNFLISNRWE